MLDSKVALIYDGLGDVVIEIFDFHYNYDLKILFFVYTSHYTEELAFLTQEYLERNCILLEKNWIMEDDNEEDDV